MKKVSINWTGVIGAVLGAILFLFALGTSPGAGAQAFVATSSAVQIPQALVLAFNGIVFALLMAGFTYVLNLIGLDLTSFATPLAGTLSAFLLGLAQNWIDLQPMTSDPYILMALNILVVVLSGLGGLFLLARRSTII